MTLIAAPFIGNLDDRVGCVSIMRVAAVVGLLVVWPLFELLQTYPTIAMLTLVQALLGVVMAFYFAPLPALMSALFPTNVRTTGMSIGYNIGVVAFGGVAPIILATLVAKTGNLSSPSFYYIAVCIVSLIALTVVRTRYAQR